LEERQHPRTPRLVLYSHEAAHDPAAPAAWVAKLAAPA